MSSFTHFFLNFKPRIFVQEFWRHNSYLVSRQVWSLGAAPSSLRLSVSISCSIKKMEKGGCYIFSEFPWKCYSWSEAHGCQTSWTSCTISSFCHPLPNLTWDNLNYPNIVRSHNANGAPNRASKAVSWRGVADQHIPHHRYADHRGWTQSHFQFRDSYKAKHSQGQTSPEAKVIKSRFIKMTWLRTWQKGRTRCFSQI